ncbi:hypothetical protein PFICI_13855 [Pestalotiopsis fici W106-1]|uniref:G-protein coupled receptors family 1 profile domain-containing protein n=1 Tax=Pestalotiopsis fici (strain W106-1 / CGMCC3.15140) TaxID=1229662 RepID=W3WJP0_PESFW|nr:uncharacterized protein PFICI_13855 [Pestalotiopsis fici W106-1]ETS73989.1 hypothetical protein PFICI_13855 [Pestalotiopsis fici W106-1]
MATPQDSLGARAAGHETPEGQGLFVVPLAATVCSMIVAIISLTLLSAFFALRFTFITSWKKAPLTSWVILAIYIDSWLFVAISMILRWGPGINNNFDMCSTAIFLCLACYISTKLIYFFLVEKAFVVWGGGRNSRLESKLYIFNSFGMLTIFIIIGILNFVFRITYLDNGKCVIGMQRPVLVPLVSFDLGVNVYLTILFLIPLRRSYSFNMDKTSGNEKLRDLVKRTFIGAVTSTLTCVLNVAIMMALNGEPGWICLLSCNLDLLADTIIVQYVTSRDNSGTRGNFSDRSKTSVAVERSIHIHTTTSSRTGGALDKSKSGSVADIDDDIQVSPFRVVAAGGFQKSTDRLKRECTNERCWEEDIELANVGNLDLGTQTHIVATTTRPFA